MSSPQEKQTDTASSETAAAGTTTNGVPTSPVRTNSICVPEQAASTEAGQAAAAERGMSGAAEWKPVFNRRQSWNKEEHKHQMQMTTLSVAGVEPGSHGFTERP